MRPGRFGAVLLGAIAVAASVPGCVSSAGRRHAPDDVVCTNEAVTGSHLVETRCTSRREIEERRKADRAAIERMLINANRPVRKTPTGSGQTQP